MANTDKSSKKLRQVSLTVLLPEEVCEWLGSNIVERNCRAEALLLLAYRKAHMPEDGVVNILQMAEAIRKHGEA